MNTALEYSTKVVQEGGRRCKKSTLNDLVHLAPLRIPLMNPPLTSLRIPLMNPASDRNPSKCLHSTGTFAANRFSMYSNFKINRGFFLCNLYSNLFNGFEASYSAFILNCCMNVFMHNAYNIYNTVYTIHILSIKDITHFTNRRRFPNDLALPPPFNLPPPFM
jgi:hypothetical protein